MRGADTARPDIWPILAVLVIVVLPAAMFLVQWAGSAGRARCRSGRAPAAADPDPHRPDVPSQWHAISSSWSGRA